MEKQTTRVNLAETEQSEVIPKKIDLKRALHNAPFEGIPLERSQPRTEQDLELKLETTRFRNIQEILDFYEKNRQLFNSSN